MTAFGPCLQAVVLVGGLGTRLGSLTRDCPKPLLEVAGKPFLDHLLFELARHGFRRVLLLCGHQADKVAALYGQGRALHPDLPLEITLVREPEPAGTGGALTFARDLLDDRFLLLNGDSLFAFNFLDLLSVARAEAAAEAPLAAVALRRIDEASRFGVVGLSGARITAFSERPQRPGPGLINGGGYWMRREILAHLGPLPCSLERDVFPRLARDGRLAGRVYQGFFHDIGQPRALAEAQALIPAFLTRPAAFLDRDGVVNLDHGYVHKAEQFDWAPEAVAAIKALNDAGRYVFVVTNQAGVGRGYYQEEDVRALHRWMQAQLRPQGAHIDAFRFCPHHPTEGKGRYLKACAWRKPGPGMLRDLMAHWPVDRDKSFLVGDNASDLQAGKAAALPQVYLARSGLSLDLVARGIAQRAGPAGTAEKARDASEG